MFRRLRDRILPSTPYLLTFPRGSTLSVERYHPDQVNNWTEGTPFSRAEGELQYMSFIPRDSSNSVMLSRGAWEEEEEEPMDTSMVSQHRSGNSTPTNGRIKNKMTLSAYKNKQASGYRSASGTANDTPTHPVAEETVKAASTAKADNTSKAQPEAIVKTSVVKEKEKSRPIEKPERSSQSGSSTKRYHSL
jgi:hypothetical protein